MHASAHLFRVQSVKAVVAKADKGVQAKLL